MGNIRKMAAVIAMTAVSMTASAAPVVLDFQLKGSFSSQGLNNAAFAAGPGNTLVGSAGGLSKRAYWIFDLSGVTDPIVSGTLSIGVPFGGYISSDATETLAIFDYHSSIGLLQNQSTTFPAGIAAYDDLGTGAQYGSKTVSEADEPTCGVCFTYTFKPLVIDLAGASFLADINAARGGLFALGGALTTLSGPDGQRMFAFTSNEHDVQLSLNVAAVPEPSTYALMIAGLGLVGWAARRRSRA